MEPKAAAFYKTNLLAAHFKAAIAVETVHPAEVLFETQSYVDLSPVLDINSRLDEYREIAASCQDHTLSEWLPPRIQMQREARGK